MAEPISTSVVLPQCTEITCPLCGAVAALGARTCLACGEKLPGVNDDVLKPQSSLWWWAGGWTMVFAANLIVPLIFATSVTSDRGRVGMVVAIALFWTVGLAFSLRRGNFAKSLLVGAGAFSLSQIIPVTQMFAGLFALGVWRLVTDLPDDDDIGIARNVDTEIGGFVVTVLTGLPLLVVCILSGYCVRGVVRLIRWQRAK